MKYTRLVLFVALLGVFSTAAGTSANIVQLSYGNISMVYKGDWLAVFHMPGCRFCNELMAAIPDVAEEIDTSVQIALIEASSSYPIQRQFHIERFPTIYYIHDGECRMYKGPQTSEKISEYVGGGWTRDDPVIGPMAPCSAVMRLYAGYVNAATSAYAVAERWAKSLNINTLAFISVGFALTVLVFGSAAIISYGNIHNSRVEEPKRPGKAGEVGQKAPQENEPQRSQNKGQKFEISKTATIASKGSGNKNSTLRMRKKKKR